jgi:hypothetical protein
VSKSGIVSHSVSPPKAVKFSVSVWAWFNWDAKNCIPLEYGIRQITNMTEKEFIEMLEEELVPYVSTRFCKRPVIFMDNFETTAIHPAVYEWFEDLKIDQFPPKSRYLSPFSNIWRSIGNNLFRESLRLNRTLTNRDELWEEIESQWSTRSNFPELWSRDITDLQEKINSVVKELQENN